MGKTNRFNSRTFVVIAMLLSGLGLPITGVANHVLQLESMTVARHAWMAAHNGLGLLFVIFCIWHVVLNRKAVFRHMAGLTARIPAASREMIAAAAIVALALSILVGHAFHL